MPSLRTRKELLTCLKLTLAFMTICQSPQTASHTAARESSLARRMPLAHTIIILAPTTSKTSRRSSSWRPSISAPTPRWDPQTPFGRAVSGRQAGPRPVASSRQRSGTEPDNPSSAEVGRRVRSLIVLTKGSNKQLCGEVLHKYQPEHWVKQTRHLLALLLIILESSSCVGIGHSAGWTDRCPSRPPASRERRCDRRRLLQLRS